MKKITSFFLRGHKRENSSASVSGVDLWTTKCGRNILLFKHAQKKKITEKKKKKPKKNLHNRNSTDRAGPWSSDHGNLQEFTRIHSAASSCEGGARRAHEHTKTSIEQGKKIQQRGQEGKKIYFRLFSCLLIALSGGQLASFLLVSRAIARQKF